MRAGRVVVAIVAVVGALVGPQPPRATPVVPAALPAPPDTPDPVRSGTIPVTVAVPSPSRLCGALLPDGYHIANGYPTRTARRFHPQDIGLFFQQVLSAPRYSATVRRCILRSTADAVLLRAIRREKTLLFPYSFDLSYDRAGELEAPWISGLAQATLMGSLRSIAAVVGESKYQKAAQKTFNSFFLSPSEGGFVAPLGADAAWVQEYPTQTPSFVLNGHLFSILAVRSFRDDPRSRALFDNGVRAASRLLPLFDIPTPNGNRSAYDLVRRNPGARLRVSGRLNVSRVEILGKGGRVLSSLPLSRAGEVTPAYPVSVLSVPRVFVRIVWQGSGSFSVRDGNAWLTLASLAAAADSRTITVEIPQRFQGREDAGRYHQIHIDLLRRIARASGDATFNNWASRWAD